MKQSFCQSDILRVQQKSNWTVGEGLLSCDKSQFDNAGWFCLKDKGIFYNAYFEHFFISRKVSVKEFLAGTFANPGTGQTLR